jgi:hypothetical protein
MFVRPASPAGSMLNVKGRWKMGRPLSTLAKSVVVTAIMQLASLGACQAALAETLDDEVPTSADMAVSAGTAAGIVESCGIDVAPIGSAFAEFLGRPKLASPGQESLLRQYKTAEAAAFSTLAADNAGSCAGATSMMRAAVHRLTEPMS